MGTAQQHHLDYWDKILREEWHWIIDWNEEWSFWLSDNVMNLLDWTSYNIDDIKDNINTVIEDDVLNFFYWDMLIKFINYFRDWKNKFFLEFIWTKNAKESDIVQLEKKWFEKRFLKILWPVENDFSVKWLWEYMLREFIEYIKKDYSEVNKIWMQVVNSNVYRILDTLKKSWDNKWYKIKKVKVIVSI